jgi:hypothetical protein
MTAMDDGISTGALALGATLTTEQHKAGPGQPYAPGTCRQCTPHGCSQRDWAERTLAALRHRARAR